MYSLALPVSLPEERSFHIDDRATVPPLPGGLSLSCEKHSKGFPLILKVTGLPDLETAKAFTADLASAIRCASLDLGYSLRPSDHQPNVATIRGFDGGWPTVFETKLGARPMLTSAHACMSEHLVTLAKRIGAGLASGRVKRLAKNPPLALAVRLFAEMEFSGGETAKFVVLFSALEVLIPKSGGTKRSRVVGLVRTTLQHAGRADAKSRAKHLDRLYEMRNDLIHEARPVRGDQVRDLAEIVRETLRLLTDAP